MAQALIDKTTIPVYVGVVGTSTLGTVNTLTIINSAVDLTPFGTGSLVTAANKLLSYGVIPIVCKVASTLDADVVGADANSGLQLLAQAESLTGKYLTALITPELSSDAIVTQLNTSAIAAGSLGIIGYQGTLANLITARGTATNFGLKSKNLAIIFPRAIESGVTTSSATHLAGLIARQVKLFSIGIAPNGDNLKGVTSITPALNLATDSVTLNNQGVVSMVVNTGGYSLKGFRNSLYPSDTGQDSLLMRVPVEGVIRRVVQEYINTRLGFSSSLTKALALESELSNLLSKYVYMGDLKKAYASLDKLASTFPTDGTESTVIYDICVSLVSGLLGSVSYTFQVVA